MPPNPPDPPASGSDDGLFTAAPLPVAPLGEAERIACLRLIRSEQIGPATFRHLINTYGGASASLEALPDLARRSGRKRPLRIAKREAAEAELDAARRIGASPLFTIEPGYPKPLAWLDQPPPVIYLKGDVELCQRACIAIVGSRRCSAAGQTLARTFASELGAHDLVVVSGLARGIDTAAHHAALPGGTIAVLAGGLDNIYPPENADLHREIGENGCLVSEQPPGFRPRGQDFPRRNRIISGLSLGVIIIEAAQRSGSLITARLAAEQGRSVFAVPGHPLDPRADGTNRLIRNGATFTLSAQDVIAELAPQLGATSPSAGQAAKPAPQVMQSPSTAVDAASITEIASSDRAAVRSALSIAPVAIDELVRTTGLSVQKLQIAVLELSLSGHVDFHGHNLVSLRPVQTRV